MELPSNATVSRKTLQDLKLGQTTIIMTADDPKKYAYIEQNISKIPKDFNCEVIVITNGSFEGSDLHKKVHFLQVPNHVNKAAMMNIGRQLASKESKYLLFLDIFDNVSKEWLEDRVKGFEFNKIIGLIGRSAPDVSQDTKNELLKNLQQIIRLTEDDFKERCCNKEGAFKHVFIESLATPVELFDKIGGFDVKEDLFDFIYQVRVQALGYGLVPQPN